MKTVNTIVKIVTALAAIAGAIYLIATYGDKIVAWAKKILGSCKCCCDGECECDCDCCCDEEDTVADDIIAAEADFEG